MLGEETKGCRFETWTGKQMWLLPPSLDELLPTDHPARFVAEFVDALDRKGWEELGVNVDGDPMGAPAYHPRALLSVWLYGFMTGVRSCRKLEVTCRDQIPYLWLTGWQYPDHNTLWRFYKGHRQAMRSLFKRTVRTAVALELLDLGLQAVDGTKVIASASKQRSYTPDQLEKLLGRVEKAIEDLEAQNEGGEDVVPARLPDQLADRNALRDRVRQAMEEQTRREAMSAPYGDQNRINLTDWDARLMKTRTGIMPAYNAQAMVSPLAPGGETTGMLLTAVDVVDENNDATRLIPMMEQSAEVTGTRVPMTLADAGYFGSVHLEEIHCQGLQVAMPDSAQPLDNPYHKDRFIYEEDSDSYICPQGKRLRFSSSTTNKGTPIRVYRPVCISTCRNCPAFGVCTKNYRRGRALEIGAYDRALRKHREWMVSEAAKEVYKLRKQLIELVFGIAKEQLSARRFLLRGLANVKAEWVVLATALNLRTLWHAWRSRTSIQWTTT